MYVYMCVFLLLFTLLLKAFLSQQYCLKLYTFLLSFQEKQV